MKRTVLIVDDDGDFRALVRPSLEQVGFAVMEAESAAAARVVLATLAPAVIVVDGILPDESGVSFIEVLRHEGNKVPIIFCTAFWDDFAAFRHMTTELGVAVVATKPVTPHVFAEQVRRAAAGEGSIQHKAVEAEDPAIVELRTEYSAALPGKVADLARAVEAARADAGAITEARSLAHRLHGTAGSYGFIEAGDLAGRLEAGFVRLERAAAGDRPALWSDLENDLAALLRVTRPASALIEASGEPRGARESRGRVLVVDDDPLTLRRLIELGRRHLLDVVGASDARTALALARQSPPDCAFLDLDLAVGAGLAGSLRELPGCASLPLAFTSLEARVQNHVAAVHAGASLFLVKPLDGAAFHGSVAHLMASSRQKRPRVLIVDDDLDFARQAVTLLQGAGIAATHLTDPLRVLDVLTEVEPDMVFLDSIMPGMSGLDVCRMLRTTPRWQDLPILFVTVQTGIEVRLAAFQAGADDYLPKPVLGPELLARVKLRLDRARLTRERISTDMLTGLLLRRAFHDQAAGRFAEARRHRRQMSVAILDIDNFKKINDTHGHVAGDDVLAGMGRLLGTRLRAEDLRARWGGEEFALLFTNEGAEAAALVLDRLRHELGSVTFRGRSGKDFRVSFSGGVASFPDDGESFDSLVAAADRRLYEAKRAGRDRVTVAG